MKRGAVNVKKAEVSEGQPGDSLLSTVATEQTDKVYDSQSRQDLIDVVQKVMDHAGIITIFGGAIGASGQQYMRGSIIIDRSGQHRKDGSLWLMHLRANSMLNQDASVEFATKTEEPYTWGEVIGSLSRKHPGRVIFNEAKHWGLGDGLFIPSPEYGRKKGMISLLGPKGMLKSWSETEYKRTLKFFRTTLWKAERLHKRHDVSHKPELTSRESVVIRFLLEARDISYIAEKTGVTPDTVQKRISRIMEKLGVTSRLAIVVKCFNEGWQF